MLLLQLMPIEMRKKKKRMSEWNLTALTFMHVDEWVKVFKEVGYDGDYYWFIP